MRLRAPIGLLALLALAATCAAAASAATPQDTRTLLRVASGITRLKVQRPVPVVVQAPATVRKRRLALAGRFYPGAARAHDASLYRALGLTPTRAAASRALEPVQPAALFYDPLTRRLVVPRGGRPNRQALMRAVVSALQDQHFDLARATRLAGNRDALAAARAASEGYSLLVAQLFATRTTSGHATGRIERFLALLDGFHSTRGVRFAAELRNLGADRAVWTALKAFPASTEQVFHLDKFLQRERPLPIVLPVDAAGLTLASDDTWGELDVRALLAVYGVPGLDRAATGWGGGRSAVYRGAGGEEAVAIALDWDSPLDAQQWRDAARRYVATAFDGAAASSCGAEACWELDGRGIAFARAGARTALVFAADAATADEVARTLVPAP